MSLSPDARRSHFDRTALDGVVPRLPGASMRERGATAADAPRAWLSVRDSGARAEASVTALRHVDSPPPPPPSQRPRASTETSVARAVLGWGSLTRTERTVALLIADGHTNRAAAAALVVSPNTIATHLRAVFTKLDVNSRVQLTRIAMQHVSEAPMDDQEQNLLHQVTSLVERERLLRDQLAQPQDPHRIENRSTLRTVEEELDQCWDLLRQRRALQAVHRDPDGAHVRPVAQVENYLPRPSPPTDFSAYP